MKVSFDAHYWILEYRIEQLTRYLELLHGEIENEKNEFTYRIESQAKDLPEETREEFYEFYSDEYQEIDHEIPRLFLSSFIIMVYSFIERELYEICCTLKVVDRSNSRTEYARVSKEKIEKTGYSIPTDLWEGIQNLGNVRNKIAHNDGRVPSNWKQPSKGASFVETELIGEKLYIVTDNNFFEYLKDHGIIEIGIPTRIIPTYEYSQFILRFSADLFSKLYFDLKLS